MLIPSIAAMCATHAHSQSTALDAHRNANVPQIPMWRRPQQTTALPVQGGQARRPAPPPRRPRAQAAPQASLPLAQTWRECGATSRRPWRLVQQPTQTRNTWALTAPPAHGPQHRALPECTQGTRTTKRRQPAKSNWLSLRLPSPLMPNDAELGPWPRSALCSCSKPQRCAFSNGRRLI